jgi:hypothetical protein
MNTELFRRRLCYEYPMPEVGSPVVEYVSPTASKAVVRDGVRSLDKNRSSSFVSRVPTSKSVERTVYDDLEDMD